MSRLLLALLLLSLVSGKLSGDERQPVFQLDIVTGKPCRGQLLSISGKWELRLSGQEQVLSVKDWLSLRRCGVSLPSISSEAQLILNCGDCLPVQGDDLQLIAERIAFSCSWLASGKKAHLPLSSVAMWWRTTPDTVNDVELNLTPTEFRLLWALVRQPGRAFSRHELMEAAMGDDALVLERTIDVHVKSLRQKLAEKSEQIETVRGVGYRFRE